MNGGAYSFELVRSRKRVDTLLQELADLLQLDSVIVDRLFQSWQLRATVSSTLAKIEPAIAELHDAEKRVMQELREENQWKSVFDNGEICP